METESKSERKVNYSMIMTYKVSLVSDVLERERIERTKRMDLSLDRTEVGTCGFLFLHRRIDAKTNNYSFSESKMLNEFSHTSHASFRIMKLDLQLLTSTVDVV